MFITHKSNCLSVVFGKYFKNRKLSSETGFIKNMSEMSVRTKKNRKFLKKIP
jgi:hypothetical protein